MTARRLVPVLLALPVLMAPGRCGFAIDHTETILIPDSVQRIVLEVDDGSVIATSYPREAVMVKRHTFGYEPSVETVAHRLEDDGVLRFEARCKYEGNCTFDHLFETPVGISFEIAMKSSQISLGYIDGDIDVDFETGWFKGIRLESPSTIIKLDAGDISLDHAVAPESVVVELGDGSVELAVPPGSYQCNFDAGGEVDTAAEVVCDDAATAVLDITVATGDITVRGAEA